MALLALCLHAFLILSLSKSPCRAETTSGPTVPPTCPTCSINATCTAAGQCECNTGFSGDGTVCQDINECSASLPQHDCVNAQCINTVGSFTCMCNTGFSNPSGDGKTCIDDPPEFVAGSCDLSRTEVADPLSDSKRISWTDPTATDSSGVVPTVTCSPASETDFRIGRHDVTCTAAAAPGNSAQCTFTVTVTDYNECGSAENDCVNAACENKDGGFLCNCNPGFEKNSPSDHTCVDNEPPVFSTCPIPESVVADRESMTQTVTWTEPTASDSTNVPPVVECNPRSGTSFMIGPVTTVVCTATDGAGNRATPSCTFTVTVTDFNECTASSPEHDCVNAQCINTNGSYTCNCNAGYNNVNMDGKTCIDNEPPVFTTSPCHMPVNEVADPSNLTTSVTWNDPQASDTTGKYPIVTCSPGSGTHFTIGQTDVTCTAKDDAGNYAVINCTFMVTVTDFDECSADVNGDNCHNYANCTNIDGGFLCDCTAGYIGDGVICTECSEGFYGLGCALQCSCVQDAECNNVNGSCTCVPGFTDAACDKNALSVELSVTNDPVLDTSGVDNATLKCLVNLLARDLHPMMPVTITNPNGTSENALMITEGVYEITLYNISPAFNGVYNCTAATLINGTTKLAWDSKELDVIAPGRIISLNDIVEGKLDESVTVDCVVFARPTPEIMWYDKNGAVINPSNPKYSITSNGGQEQLTSSLKVMNLARVDNGTYICETSNSITDEKDQRGAAIIVIEVPEVDNVNAVPISFEEIEVTWQVTFDGNAPPFTCRVDYRKPESASTDWTRGTYQQEPALSRRITNLAPYTSYPVRVVCRNKVDEGMVALLSTPVQTLQAAPDAPLAVRVTATTSTSFTVEWNEPKAKRGTIAFYIVTTIKITSSEPKMHRTSRPSNPAPTSLVVTGLNPFTNYTIYVTAFNVEGNEELMGENSNTTVQMTGEAAPSAPVSVQLSNEGDTCIVTWDPPREENGIIISYRIFHQAYKYPEPGKYESTDLDVSKSSDLPWPYVNQRLYAVNKTALAPYAQFRFKISANTTVGEGSTSEETNVTCDSPPAAPTEHIVTPEPPDFIGEDTPVITPESFWMTVQPASTRNGPISCYDIVVVQLPEGEVIDGKTPDANYPVSRFGSFSDSQNKPGTPYIARSMSGNNFTRQMNVKIGNTGSSSCNQASRRRKRDTKSTHLGDDGPLQASTTYTAFVRAYVILEDGRELYSSSPLMQPITTEPGANTAAVVIGIILALLVAVVVALVVMIYVKRRKQVPLLHDGQNGVAMVPVKEKEAEMTHMVVLPIPIEDLEEKVKQKSQNDDEVFKAEFKSIPEATGDVTRDATNLECNKEKNRYINIGAYDQTRVKLSVIDDVEGSDYINACYIDGYEKSRKFIAAQGPREDTVLDFWRMIWEQNCATIIMLTKCLENGREKCAEYWPEEDAIMYDDIIVTLDDVVTCADYVIRKFTMQKHIETEDEEDEDAEPIVGESRTLMQFHFLAWPDFGIPKYPHSMLCFVKRIRHMTGTRIEPGNIVVHCSAGVGRTGTYILIDYMLDMMKKEKKVDIYNVIYSLRSQRNLLVQSLVQYIFIHKALMEEYLYGHTEVDVGSMRHYYQKLCGKASDGEDTGVEKEYRAMASLPVDNTDQKTGNIEANKQKNRLRQVIPYDRNRVKLERLTGQEHSNYINASFIDGYEHKKAYVAAQGPLPNTMGDFWRMAWENQCSTIVMLSECEERGQNVCTKYWPEAGETLNPAFLTVAVKEVKEDDDCTIRDLEVSTTKGAGTKLIRQYHYHGWPEVGIPDNSASLVKVIGLAHEYQQDIGRFPILVHCSAGSGRTGVFIALSYLLQRAKAEGIVDVFQAVRTLRQQRPHMVQDVAQYQFCYRAMNEYLDSFDHYANFK